MGCPEPAAVSRVLSESGLESQHSRKVSGRLVTDIWPVHALTGPGRLNINTCHSSGPGSSQTPILGKIKTKCEKYLSDGLVSVTQLTGRVCRCHVSGKVIMMEIMIGCREDSSVVIGC